MSNLQIPDWNKQDAQGAFPFDIDDINSFTLTADFPAIADWENAKLRALLHDRLHDDVTKLLRTAEFYSDNKIQQRKGIDHFIIAFTDDEYDFEIRCYNNRLVLNKNGLRMKTFHHWYHAAVPGIKQLFESVLSVMSKELSRNQAITSVYYQFCFIAYDFVDKGKKLKNFQVLNKLITQSPNQLGEIEPMKEDRRDISRLDYSVQCWDGSGKEDRRNLRYAVEAPANRGYSGLWFYFGYSSETYKDSITGEREWIEPAVLLEEYERAYDFLWKRGMGGFMKSLLHNIKFETTATYIP